MPRNETDNIAHFKLENYKLISQGKPISPCSTKGGLIIYLNQKFKDTPKMTINKYSTQEGQIIKVTNSGLKKTINLVNMHSPPKDNNAKYT